MKKIRMLHVTASLKIGGAETVLCDLIDGLGSDKFEHHVVYFHHGPKVALLQAAGVPLYQVNGVLTLYDPVFFVRLFRVIKKIAPDGIHSLLWSANVSSRLVARLLSIPHVSVYHNNVDQDGLVRNLFDRLTRKFSKKLVAVSHEVANSIKLSDKFVPAQKLVVIHNGVDVHTIKKRAQNKRVSRSALAFSDDAFVFGSVGRFNPVKNYPLLLESFSQLCARYEHVRLVLVGIGPDEQRLRTYAQQLGIDHKVRFVVGASAYGYYPVFDCFVQSSNKEGISIALLEAMACALPCVVTNCAKEHAVITHKHDGLLVPAQDGKQLVQALECVLLDSVMARTVGKRASQTVQIKFEREIMLAGYLALLEGF